jgi:amino acid adenylation domain-containing protein
MAERDMALDALKKKILEQRLKKKIDSQPRIATNAAIPRADRTAALPLSWAQQRLWFLDQLDPAAGAAYHIPAALRLRGTLDAVTLKRALDRIVARHENLRTTFSNGDTGPVQVIAPDTVGFALAVHDLSSLDDASREAELARSITEESRAPFDLATGPLFRGRLLTLADDDHALLLTQHHIVSDGWSLGVLVREVTTLYAAFVEGREDPLPPLPIQYADYAVWQRGWLQGEALQRQLEFWRKHLSGAPALLELPTDRPRPPVQSHAGDVVPLKLSEALSRDIFELSQRHSITPFMTLLAAWAVLLSRYGGQQEVVVGTPVANRQRLEIEPLVGFFVNTLALRVSLDNDPTVADLLAQVRMSTLDAYSHQDLPFEQVVEALQPQRSLSYSPIFQTLFAFNNTPEAGETSLPGLRLSPLGNVRHTTHFDLELGLREADGVIRGNIGYCSDLFDRASIERIADGFVRILQSLVANDDQRVSALPLLSAVQKQEILEGFNATAADMPVAGSLPELFAVQARRTPDAPAVAFEGDTLTYAELDRRANQIAHRLIASGVRPDDRVAICAERGIDLVIGVLGIVKAGAGYVPLDPSYPHERLRYMLEDSAPSALLSQNSMIEALPLLSECSVPVLRLDDVMQDAAMDRDPAVPGIGPGHLAYVIYTSGSTGMPKGVAMPQGPLLNLLAWQRGADADAHSQERVLQFSALGFDVAFQELFHTLGTGGCLLPIREAVRQDPFALAAFIEDLRVQRIFLPFVAFQGLVAAAEQSGRTLPSLMHVITAGEQLFINPMIRSFFSRVPGRRLHNQYGPTETHVATAYTLDASPAHWTSTPPIGRPIANARAYLLDAHGQPVPVGVSGELYLAGDCVARGYLNRPDLTAERFLRDPFSHAPDARMYRTGDLGRWLPDGNIEYLGRNDFQVKIRGFRIELGEIEAKLSACNGVREAVVMAREDGAGGKRLVAYLLAKSGEVPTAAELRTQLAQELAEYMIPGAFVTMDAWPMTPSGKLDRRALPAPDQSSVAVREYVVPEGEIEQTLAGIWQTLLGLDRVGRDDHFFEIGGHSLLAVQLVTHVRASLGIELPLRTIFAQPTLAGLAQSLSAQDRVEQITIPRADRDAPLPLSWAQQRLWFIDQLDGAAGAAYHMPVALRLHGRLDRTALKRTLDRIVARHENLRTTFVNGDAGPVQVIAPEAIGFVLNEIDLSALADDARDVELRRQSLEEARASFDMATGPLIRGRLLTLADGDHALLLTQHHIVSDGWSMGILVKEVTALYAAFVEGREDPLPPLPIQYADYAVWQRGWLQGAALQQQLDFWRKHLQGAPGLLELPTDRPRPPMQSHAGDVVSVQFSASLTEGLRSLSQRHGTTMFMTLLAGWSALLSRLSGQSDVVIGSPVANRQRTEVEPLIGFFVNTMALRVTVEDDPSVSQLLSRVRELTLDAYTHQDVPFEQVVEALQPQRSMSYSPLFQTMLSVNNTPAGGTLTAPGLVFSAVRGERNTTHFDLELMLSDSDEGLFGGLSYSTALFDRATIERLLGSLVSLLQSLVANDDQRVSALPLLSAVQKQEILEGFNATAADMPVAGSLPELFAVQARRTPDAPAVAFEGDTLTYAELDRRANQIAHRLIASGVRPDDRVAICAERGIDLVIGVLGIVKAGAGYVPLDPSYPHERLRYMLEDSAPSALLSQNSMIEALPLLSECSVPVLRLDDVMQDAAMDRDPAVPGIGPGHLAYVIYTSGSTGMPKGVAMPQGPLLNLLAWQRGADADAHSQERVLQFSALGFDVAFQELFHTLGTGGCLLPIREAVRQDPFALAAFIEDLRVQRIFLPFVAFQGLVAAAEQSGRTLPSLMHVITAGEQLFINPMIRSFFSRVPGRRLHNQYGPTETHVATAYTLDASPAHWTSTPPIGRPIANARAYLLDAHGQPVPVGVSGELYLAGDCVARGYLNRPDLTAERFLRDPFSHAPDARMYRTGDLGRWLPDGNIEYLGRNDFQVKIRGFRIELGEIEAKLSACNGVREAVVMAREDGAGGKRLVAYLLAKSGEVPTAAELRTQLAQELAEYMIPGAFVTMDAWPMTPSGKLDRRALPAPDQSSVAVREYVVPEGEIEQTLAGIWQTLLGLDRVGRDDHFFEIGGHSLLAVQLVTHVRASLGIELPLRTIFAQPTLAGLAQSLSAQDRVEQITIPRADRDAPLPLSWAQQRLWFIDQLDGAAGAAYHMPVALRLHGRLDRTALKRTLDRIVARHENLRTTFVNGDAGPVQVIAPEAIGFVLNEIDLSALADDARDVELRRQSLEEARASFDMATGPLIRGRLLTLADGDHALLLTQHHIVSDGWSMGILVKEVTALYAAFVEGREDPLPPLPIQYADYAVWQRGWLQGAALQQQLDFWRKHLQGAPGLLELPTDRPRPPMQSHAGDVVSVQFSASLTEGLRSLSQRHGTTMFMTLLAGWSALLSRLSGQSDVVIGSPVANRQRTEVEPLIGFFVNTMALRVTVEDDPSVSQLLSRVRELTLDAYTHQDVPFEQVVEALQPQRSMSYSPLFQTMLSVNNTPAGGTLTAPGLVFSAVRGERNTTHFDLELAINEHADGMSAAMAYSTALFDRSTVERTADYFMHMLEAMVADDRQKVSGVRLLSDAQRQQVTSLFNATGADYPREKTIHGLFEYQAKHRPGASALIFETRTLSYAELNQRANRVAHRLISMGVKPDDRVAICAERGIDMVVGVFGILKAGAGYVPVDPSYPRERLLYMLKDSAPSALVIDVGMGEVQSDLANTGLPFIRMHDAALDSEAHCDPVVSGLAPTNLAYVIYTSGSTGQPKGVMVEHRSVVNLWSSLERDVFQSHGRDAVIALNAGLSFDASIQSLTQLLSGRCVSIVPASVRTDGVAMLAYLAKDRVEALDCTPAQLEVMIAADLFKADKLPLKTILVGGDAVQKRTWDIAAASSIACFNVYGPTECTVDATLARIVPGVQPHIGRAVANTQVYLLDECGEPVPVGVTGELYIGGHGVARGYFDRSELNTEKFLKDPFSIDPGARMYRTGDLGRWRQDGNIEYLGRNDFQVKIRGFRIELGEIEAVVCACDGVSEAVVIACEDAEGDKYLVAYIIAEQGADPSAADLRKQVSGELPGHMIPRAFVTVDAWPLTPNGKLDRRALPAPDQSSVAVRDYVSPEGEIEQMLAEIWQTLLGLDRVGRNDNFFEIGGHSLLAIRMFHLLRERIGIAPALSAVFAAPTVSMLAIAIEEIRSKKSPAPLLVSLQTVRGDERPLFCVHPVGGQVGVYRDLALQLRSVCPVYGLQAPELIGEKTLGELNAAVMRYTDEIRSLQPHGPYRLVGWSTGGLFAEAVAQRLFADGDVVEYLGLLDTFPLTKGIENDAEALALRALQAEIGARGLSVDLSWQSAFMEQGKTFATILSLAPEDALRYAGIDSVPGMDTVLLTQMLAQLPITVAHLRMLSDHNTQAAAMPVHRIWAKREAAADCSSASPGSVHANEWVQEIVAGHHAMLRTPHVEIVAGWIATRISSKNLPSAVEIERSVNDMGVPA